MSYRVRRLKSIRIVIARGVFIARRRGIIVGGD